MTNVGLFIPDPPRKPATERINFEAMTKAELEAFANANGVDISAAKTKADIIRIIDTEE